MCDKASIRAPLLKNYGLTEGEARTPEGKSGRVGAFATERNPASLVRGKARKPAKSRNRKQRIQATAPAPAAG